MKKITITTRDLSIYKKTRVGLASVLKDFDCSETSLLKHFKSLFGGNETKARNAVEDLRKIDEEIQDESEKKAKTRRKNEAKRQEKLAKQELAEKEKLDAMSPLEKKQYARAQCISERDSILEQLTPISEKLGEQSKFIAELRKKKKAAEKALKEIETNLTNAVEAHEALKKESANLNESIESFDEKIRGLDKEIKSLSQPVFLVYVSDGSYQIDAENFDMDSLPEEYIDSEEMMVANLCKNDKTGRFDLRKREIRPVARLLAAVRATGRKDCVVNFDDCLIEMKAVFEELR